MVLRILSSIHSTKNQSCVCSLYIAPHLEVRSDKVWEKSRCVSETCSKFWIASTAIGITAWVAYLNRGYITPTYDVLVPSCRFKLLIDRVGRVLIGAMMGPIRNFLMSRTAAASWIRKESHACLNSVKTLVADIQFRWLNAWFFIWAETLFRIFCISDASSSSYRYS